MKLAWIIKLGNLLVKQVCSTDSTCKPPKRKSKWVIFSIFEPSSLLSKHCNVCRFLAASATCNLEAVKGYLPSSWGFTSEVHAISFMYSSFQSGYLTTNSSNLHSTSSEDTWKTSSTCIFANIRDTNIRLQTWDLTRDNILVWRSETPFPVSSTTHYMSIRFLLISERKAKSTLWKKKKRRTPPIMNIFGTRPIQIPSRSSVTKSNFHALQTQNNPQIFKTERPKTNDVSDNICARSSLWIVKWSPGFKSNDQTFRPISTNRDRKWNFKFHFKICDWPHSASFQHCKM
jgi:hypothetical protein